MELPIARLFGQRHTDVRDFAQLLLLPPSLALCYRHFIWPLAPKKKKNLSEMCLHRQALYQCPATRARVL